MRAPRSLLLAGILLAPLPAPGLRAAPAAAKPEPASPTAAAPAPGNALSPEQIQSLQQAIKALLQRYEDQGNSFTAIHEELQKLRTDINQNLGAADLSPQLKDSVATIVRRILDLQNAIGKQAGDAEARSATAKAQNDTITGKLAALQEQVARLDDEVVQFRKAEAGRVVSAPAVAPAFPLALVSGLVAACTLLLAGLVLWAGAQRRREQQATLAAISGAIGQTREELDRRLQAVESETGRLLAASEKSVTAALAEFRRTLENLAPAGPPPPPAPPPVTMPPRKTPPPISTEERTTVAAGGTSVALAASLWPAEFRDPASPLARWRALLESHLASKEHPALPVLSAVVALRVTVERAPRLQEVADAVAAVAVAVHAYWGSLTDLSEDDRQRASADWIRGLKQYVAGVAPTLEIREVEPGARFDPDTMQTVQSGAGNHLNVAAKFSWVILDRGGERARVLHRARIATT